MLKVIEYIWLDGTRPVKQLRSKTKIAELPDNPMLSDFPEWSFDGSSTNQAVGSDSDCILRPACFVRDSLTDGGDYLLLCEVLNPDGSAHSSNTRSKLIHILSHGGDKHEPWFGFEQEYTMFEGRTPLGWPNHGYPGPQGPYYCGVGAEQIFGREIATHHMHACMEAGLIYYGLNAEVMPGQWEFQIGPRGTTEDSGALNVSDHLWIARWLIHRISEEYGVHISLENKPVKGDWNGAGMHTNFSTKEMRDVRFGKDCIEKCLKHLETKHSQHIKVYGYKLEERLTGDHETSAIDDFSAGEADRGCSIRVPRMIADKGFGYLEDRRPGANSDPYLVAARIIATVCNIDDSILVKSRP